MNFDSSNAAFLPSDPAQANMPSGMRTLFVDAIGGSDSNIGSFRDPFETITRAIMEAKYLAGKNIISIAPGNYNENPVIDDYGGLDIRGRGDSPGAVLVSGSNMGTALQIEGGSSINIENMMFVHGMNGIHAENVDSLTLRNIRSRNNSGYGLHAVNINNLQINFSNFVENGLTGVAIANSQNVDIGRSYFAYNSGNGVGLDHNQNVKLRHLYSSDNGEVFEDLGPMAAAVSQNGNGLAAFHNENLEFRGGYFLNNGADGVNLLDNHDVSFYGIQASHNGANGIGGESNQSIIVRDGRYAQNQDNGVGLRGLVGESESKVYDLLSSSIRAIGGLYWANLDKGLDLVAYATAELRAMDVQWNQDGGVMVSNSDEVWMNGIVSMSNRGDGIFLNLINEATANHVYSALNYADGFSIGGGAEKVNLRGGNYSDNGRGGLNFDGIGGRRLLENVNITGTVAMHNEYSGLGLNNANNVSVVDGKFSWNGDHGISLYNVGQFSAERTRADGNYKSGLWSDTGATVGGNGENGNVDPMTMRGSLNFKQSYFTDNGHHGLLISSIGVVQDVYDVGRRYNGGRTNYEFDVNFDRVTSRGNGDSGVLFGRDDYYFENGTATGSSSAYENGHGGHVYFDVHFDKGNFSNNGADGIRAEASGIFSSGYEVWATASTYRTTVNHNAGNGLFVDALAPWVAFQMYAEKGAFNFNGLDGLSVWTGRERYGYQNNEHGEAHVDDGHASHVGDFYANQIVAHNNGSNGLNFHSQQTNPVFLDDKFGSFSEAYVAHPLATIYGGSFNNNAMSGINMNVATFNDIFSDVGSSILVERAIAKRNGQNGLTIFGQTPGRVFDFSPRGIQVDIVRGVFNRNQVDGVQLWNIANVNLDGPIGVANRDDGFEGNNLGDVSGDYKFVANLDQDFVLRRVFI